MILNNTNLTLTNKNTMDIYILGDNHGQYTKLLSIISKFDLRDSYILHVGDGGEGFHDQYESFDLYDRLNSVFLSRNIQYLSIRGNHSNPDFFHGNFKFSNFELLEDYSFREIEGIKFFFVGGAVSIDRKVRQEGVSWWRGEEFVLIPEKAQKCDILITHSAPIWNGPTTKGPIRSWEVDDATLWAECCEERKNVSSLIELCQPKYHFCGHFHSVCRAENNGCKSRVCGELELYKLNYEK